jgi:ribosomal protein S18 acetylase RimI-like enzyme
MGKTVSDRSEIEIREIRFGSNEYEEELVLRNAVLRLPLGLVLGEKDVATDARDLNLGAFLGSKLVGCLILRVNSPSQVQMRQVAVDPSIHGQGIGRKLVLEFESRTRAIGATEILMDARESARLFYEKLGYEVASEIYIQSTIQHVKMRKGL